MIIDEEASNWWRLSASELACYEYSDDTEIARAQRAAFMEGYVKAMLNIHQLAKLPISPFSVTPEMRAQHHEFMGGDATCEDDVP